MMELENEHEFMENAGIEILFALDFVTYRDYRLVNWRLDLKF